MKLAISFLISIFFLGSLGAAQDRNEKSLLLKSVEALLRAGKSQLSLGILNLLPESARKWEWRYLKSESNRANCWNDPSWIGLMAFPFDLGLLTFDSFGAVGRYDSIAGRWLPRERLFRSPIDFAKMDSLGELAVLAAGDQLGIVSLLDRKTSIVAKLRRFQEICDAAFLPKKKIVYLLAEFEGEVEVLRYGYDGMALGRLKSPENCSRLNICGDERFLIMSSKATTVVVDLDKDYAMHEFSDTRLFVPLSSSDYRILQLSKNTGTLQLIDLKDINKTIWAIEENYLSSVNFITVVPSEEVAYAHIRHAEGDSIQEIKLLDGSRTRFLSSPSRGSFDNFRVIDTSWTWVWKTSSAGLRIEFVHAPDEDLMGVVEIEGNPFESWDIGFYGMDLWVCSPGRGIRRFASDGQDQRGILDPIRILSSADPEVRKDGWLVAHEHFGLDLDFSGATALVKKHSRVEVVDVHSGSTLNSMEIPSGNITKGRLVGKESAIVLVDKGAYLANWKGESLLPLHGWSRNSADIADLAVSGRYAIVVGQFGLELYDVVLDRSFFSREEAFYSIVEKAEGKNQFILGSTTGFVTIIDTSGTVMSSGQAPNRGLVSAMAFDQTDKSWIVGAGEALYRWKNLKWSKFGLVKDSVVTSIAVQTSGSRIAIFQSPWGLASNSQLSILDERGKIQLTLPAPHGAQEKNSLRFMNGKDDLVQVSKSRGLQVWRTGN